MRSSSACARTWCSSALDCFSQARGHVGGGHGLGRERRVDDQQTQVVLGELAEPGFRQDHDADALVLVHHRRHQQRLFTVLVGAGNRDPARIPRRVIHQLRNAELGHPARDPLANGHREVLGGLLAVHASVALEGHGSELVANGSVHPGVVVADELSELRRDRGPDVTDIADPGESRPQPLDGLQLGGPGGHPAERARRADGDRGVARERFGSFEIAVSPAVRPIVGKVEDPLPLVAVHERGRKQAPEALLDRGRADRAGAPRAIRAQQGLGSP